MTLYNGPRLLVPIQVDALVVDDALNAKEQGKWAREKTKYSNIPNLMPTLTDVLATSGDVQTGVHLQWVLPDSLCQGAEENGELTFPYIPNRWLVVRTLLKADLTLDLKGWVILSDHLEETLTPEGSEFLRTDANGDFEAATIGKAIDLNNWTGEKNSDSLFLTAIGAGDAAFNSYTVNHNNVFSFVDDLKEYETEKLNIQYFVAGWYSATSEEPLSPKSDTMEDILTALHDLSFSFNRVKNTATANDDTALQTAEKAFENWSKANGLKNNSLIPKMLCHGTLHSVIWNGKAGDAIKSTTGKPNLNLDKSASLPDIIIANTGFDALVALLNQKIGTGKTNKVGELLEAFEHHLLSEMDKTNGQSVLDRAVHQSWFIPESSGKLWTLTPQNDAPNNWRTVIEPIIPLLDIVNQHQATLENLVAQHHSEQAELYNAWYKKSKFGNDYEAYFAAQLQTVQQTAQNIQQQQILVEQSTTALQAAIQAANLENLITLQEKARPRYYEANDPTILIHAAKGSNKYGFSNVLQCRYTGQTLTALKEYFSGESMTVTLTTLPNLNFLPKEIEDLLKESILLNHHFSSYFRNQLTDSTVTTNNNIAIQQTIVWNPELYEELDPAMITTQAGFTGLRPDFRSYNKYTLPWSPLFLDWQVSYYSSGNAQNALDNWKLNEYDYTFTGTDKVFLSQEENKLTFEGRSLLSSQEAPILQAKLRDFKNTLTDEEEQLTIETIIEVLGQLDIVTQRISGFNEALLTSNINDVIPVPPKEQTTIDALASATVGLPMVDNETKPTFSPIRSGALFPEMIRVVDDFGIALYPLGQKGKKQPKKLPIKKGKGMDNAAIQKYPLVQLPPRIAQPARIEMEWVSNTDDQKAIQFANAENPVCGWVIQNKLDRSLVFFDAAGKTLGAFFIYKRGDVTQARWNGNDVTTISNTHLQQLIQTLLNMKGNGLALSALLEQIDSSLWITDPMGEQQKQGLSVLVGRPLALVRTRVNLTLKGESFVNQALNKTGKKDTSGLLDVQFPARIGAVELPSNGVMGYYRAEDYSQFFVLENTLESDKSTTIQHPYTPKSKHESLQIGQNKFAYFTVLLDPRGSVHTTTGILPTFQLQLPNIYVEEPIKKMEITFRTGPLLTDPDQLRMPTPSSIRGQLSFTDQEGTKPIKAAMINAAFPLKRHQLKEGELTLKDGFGE